MKKLYKLVLKLEDKYPAHIKYIIGAVITPFLLMLMPLFLILFIGRMAWKLIFDWAYNKDRNDRYKQV